MKPFQRHCCCLALSALLTAACGGNQSITQPTASAPSPSPAPSAAPTPTPSPTPSPSASGLRAVLSLVRRQMECKPGVTPPAGLDPFKVGCAIEVRLDIFDRHGVGVPDRVTGSNVTWQIAEGASLITLPWDENVFRRWMTAIAAGRYRIVATLVMKKTHEPLVGELAGEITD